MFRTVDRRAHVGQSALRRREDRRERCRADPTNPRTIFAGLYEHRMVPWSGEFSGAGTGLGNPSTPERRGSDSLSRARPETGILSSSASRRVTERIYVTVSARGEAAGSIDPMTAERPGPKPRPIPAWAGTCALHPRNPDVAFVATIAAYRSDDGGRTFTSIKGAPGGDDYQRVWINPEKPDIMLFTADQGATITVNGGRTWSSWYNQPTAQTLPRDADNEFPDWIYGGSRRAAPSGRRAAGAAARSPFATGWG